MRPATRPVSSSRRTLRCADRRAVRDAGAGFESGAVADYHEAIADGRPPTERASDAEREAVVERLRTHAVAGRLDLEELSLRAERAYRAKTVGELVDVLRDLPGGRKATARRARRPRPRWYLPAFGTVCGAGTTVVVAHFDGGFRGPLDGVAAVPLWATLACGGLFAVRLLTARLRANVPSRTPRAT